METVELIAESLKGSKSLFNEVFREVKDLRLDWSIRQHVVAAALGGSTIEHCAAVVQLIEVDNVGPAFVVLSRGMKAFVDLLAAADDPEYEHIVRANYLKEHPRFLRRTQAPEAESNPYFRALASAGDVEGLLAEESREFEALKQRGKRPLSIRERFELVDQMSLYDGPYRSLCWHGHNNLNVLEQRHLLPSKDGIELQVFKECDPDDVVVLLETAVDLISDTVTNLKILVTGEDPPSMTEIRARFEALRQLWGEAASPNESL